MALLFKPFEDFIALSNVFVYEQVFGILDFHVGENVQRTGFPVMGLKFDFWDGGFN